MYAFLYSIQEQIIVQAWDLFFHGKKKRPWLAHLVFTAHYWSIMINNLLSHLPEPNFIELLKQKYLLKQKNPC